MLQSQTFMFSRGFARMLAATKTGSPVAVAGPVSWTARLIAAHSVAANSTFVIVQLLLALGIAWRPTIKIALAASIPWSLAVWWLGEGLGGVLAPGVNPITGAPGAVILYALLAIVLWPAGRKAAASFPAAHAIGGPAARAAWLALWGGLAWLTVRSVSQAPRVLPDAISALAAGQPRWLAGTDAGAARLIADHQIAVALTLAALLAIIAFGVFLPASAARTTLTLAFIVALATWVVGQNFGGIFVGTSTDPNTGPLLVLLAAAYWPASAGPVPAEARPPDLGPARARLPRARLPRANSRPPERSARTGLGLLARGRAT
jgi:hypothetical protein